MRDAGKAIFYLSYLKNSIAPPDLLVEGHPSPHPSPSAPSAPRFLGGTEGAYLIYLSGPTPFSKILDPPLVN